MKTSSNGPLRRPARLLPGQSPVARGGTFAWLKNFRRLRIRTERRADVHQAILSLACSLVCLRKLILN